MMSTHPFDHVRITFFMLMWLVYPYFLFGVDIFTADIGPDAPEYVWDLTYSYYLQLTLLIAIALTAIFPVKLPQQPLLGRSPTNRDIRTMTVLAVYLYINAIACIYLVFWPLSFSFPLYVEYSLINGSEIVYADADGYPLLPNLLSIISLCVLAPLIEEFAFRGVILPRLARLMSLPSAIFWSSLTFGIVHTDVLGATIFGIVMCLVYLRTQSLWLPIFCHAIYNFGVWLVELGYKVTLGYDYDYDYTLADFQESYSWGVWALLISIIWTALYLKHKYKPAPWRLPMDPLSPTDDKELR
ncbi:MAG: type II CAAX endopeptidase family protein [Pseudomonadota bacterium]